MADWLLVLFAFVQLCQSLMLVILLMRRPSRKEGAIDFDALRLSPNSTVLLRPTTHLNAAQRESLTQWAKGASERTGAQFVCLNTPEWDSVVIGVAE